MAVWNEAWYKRLPLEARSELLLKLKDAYDFVKDSLSKLQKYSILDADLGDPQIVEAVIGIFEVFRKVRVNRVELGFTGTSKLMHLLYPKLFIMADQSIRKAYHVLHSRQSMKHALAKCYLEFLRQSQIIARSLVKNVGREEKLWEAHKSLIPPNSRIVLEALDVDEPLTKLLDECNYTALTRKYLNNLIQQAS